MKDYIKDNGKIRGCTSNIAKMNVFEYWWHFERFGYFARLFEGLIEGFKRFAVGIYQIVGCSLFLILFPIGIVIVSLMEIKRAKKDVERFKGD